jgi:anti-sigma factor RsiW
VIGMTDKTISCELCREMLSARSDGEAASLEAEVDAHLETCAACAEYRDDLDAVRSALHGWKDERPPEIVRRPVRRLAAAAAVAAAIIAGFAAGRATAPGPARTDGATVAAPPSHPPIERERFVVPERNEIHSTISLAAVEERERALAERSVR